MWLVRLVGWMDGWMDGWRQSELWECNLSPHTLVPRLHPHRCATFLNKELVALERAHSTTLTSDYAKTLFNLGLLYTQAWGVSLVLVARSVRLCCSVSISVALSTTVPSGHPRPRMQTGQHDIAVPFFQQCIEVETSLEVPVHAAYQPLAAVFLEMGTC